MLPFDNKSEFQVVVNLPEGTTLETTARVLDELSHEIRRVPEAQRLSGVRGHRGADQLQRPRPAGTTCARVPSWAICRSTSSTSIIVRARAMRSRWLCGRPLPPSAGNTAPPCRSSKCLPAPRCSHRSSRRSTDRAMRTSAGSPPSCARCSIRRPISSMSMTAWRPPARRYVVEIDRQKAAYLGISQD